MVSPLMGDFSLFINGKMVETCDAKKHVFCNLFLTFKSAVISSFI